MKVELLDYMGDDLTVVDAARVSFSKESNWDLSKGYPDLSEKDQKLIKYLAKEGHYSPFGHCFASFRISAPIFVHRQLIKHEYLRCNEVSRRYVGTPPELFMPETWRGKADNKKQGSAGPLEYSKVISMAVEDHYNSCLKYYDYLLSSGVAPEQARMVLPLSMYTEWVWSGSLDAFANMCNLRLKADTQEETRTIAKLISDELSSRFPYSWKALVNAD